MKPPSQLILITTYKCNLHCSYCPVTRSDKDLSALLARKALAAYLAFFGASDLNVKFFGGEPFLNFPVIKETVRVAKRMAATCRFTVSSNGILINKQIYGFLKSHSDVEVWLSPHADQGARNIQPLVKLPNIGTNILISPKNVSHLAERFLQHIDEGYQKFNFLPAYFINWGDTPVNILRHEFGILAGMIKELRKRGMPIQIKNLAVSGSTPLFNDGFVVDHNGDVFQNNMVLSKYFSGLKPQLRIGSVNCPEKIRWNRDINHHDLLVKHLPRHIYRSTIIVDKILGDFVAALR